MEHLFDKLEQYGGGETYPYHMPGHKRRCWGMLPEEMYRRDITEIEGFDDLHHPEGILKNLQEHAAVLYGAEESFYLVNGSTSGILSAVSAALPAGGHILMARNCHKAAYHAVYLRNLSVSYLYPELLETYDIPDVIKPEQVRKALEQESDIGAVLIVSPTYEGRISDIKGIADAVHEKGIPLIVDEAHGAHLGFSPDFAPNSCQAGADLVVHSVHKTLPSLTQTALLHVSGRLIDRERLRRFLRIYQSSSPSYLLMASIDNALRYVEETGTEAFAAFAQNYRNLVEALTACEKLRFLSLEPERQDIGKLLISTKMTNVSGKSLCDILLKKYHLQLEMAAETYALAMFTVNDTEEGYKRLQSALLEIDALLGERTEDSAQKTFSQMMNKNSTPASAIPLAQAWDMDRCHVELQNSVGCYAGEFVNLYPPGIPLLVPGEEITVQTTMNIMRYINAGLCVQGIEVKEGKTLICILR